MTHIEKQHLEAIEKAKRSWTYGSFSHFKDKAAESCARITQHHGEIQRLEGMIEGMWFVYYLGNSPTEMEEIEGKIWNTEQQLKELKV